MTDTSYYDMRGTISRSNANGETVSLEDFAGQFIWSDYAAPWCGPCTPQTQAIKQVERSLDEADAVVFLTIMTSDMGGFGDPATQQTAAEWASRFQLDPTRVLAANLTAMTIPKHLLFSPEGHVLFEKTAPMKAAEIGSVLEQYMDDWWAWKQSGDFADWMHMD